MKVTKILKQLLRVLVNSNSIFGFSHYWKVLSFFLPYYYKVGEVKVHNTIQDGWWEGGWEYQ